MRFATNEFKLKKEFKAVFGTSVFDYRLNAKLLKAKHILLNTDILIAEIAYNAGYSAPSHFTRAFKNLFGITPKDLRKNGR